MTTHTIATDRLSGPYAEKRDARDRLVCHDCERVIRRDMGRFVCHVGGARVVCGWCIERAMGPVRVELPPVRGSASAMVKMIADALTSDES